MSAVPGAPARRPLPPLPPPPRSRYRRRSRPAKSFAAALGLTVVNAVLPGTGFLVAGRRWLGAITLFLFLVAVGAGFWLITGGQHVAARLAVNTTSLLWVLGVVGVGALVWMVVIVAGYRMLVPRPTSAPRHVVGGLLCVLLV